MQTKQKTKNSAGVGCAGGFPEAGAFQHLFEKMVS